MINRTKSHQIWNELWFGVYEFDADIFSKSETKLLETSIPCLFDSRVDQIREREQIIG